jgi:hypothetical protein
LVGGAMRGVAGGRRRRRTPSRREIEGGEKEMVMRAIW